MTNVMDEELNQQHIQQIQELEQLRVNLEMMEDTKPSRKGWIVFLIFFIITL